MYRQEELLQYVECTEGELEKIISDLGIRNDVYSQEDLDLIKKRVEMRKEKMNKIALLLVAIAALTVLTIFVLSMIVASNMSI